MLYPQLFKQLKSVRLDMEKDIPWDQFDASLLSQEQARTIKMNAITEWWALETRMLHSCSEIRLNYWYRRASELHTEPVIKQIYSTLSQHEAHHGGGYLRYMKRAIKNFGDEARAAFSKVGVLMASAQRTAQALHPTNLHVNESLFPRDTVQSRLPNPDWLEHWLDHQIKFDAAWETKVVDRILHNLSLLHGSFKTVQDLNCYRKDMAKAVADKTAGGAALPQPV